MRFPYRDSQRRGCQRRGDPYVYNIMCNSGSKADGRKSERLARARVRALSLVPRENIEGERGEGDILEVYCRLGLL